MGEMKISGENVIGKTICVKNNGQNEIFDLFGQVSFVNLAIVISECSSFTSA